MHNMDICNHNSYIYIYITVTDVEMRDASPTPETSQQASADVQLYDMYANPTPGTYWQDTNVLRDVHMPPRHLVKGI